MGFYTTSKTTKKRDKCISKKQAENSALQQKIEQQKSEIERLKAQVEQLEKDSFKNGMRDLLLQAMASVSEMPMYPVDLETEDGSFIKAVIAIKIQEVGVAK